MSESSAVLVLLRSPNVFALKLLKVFSAFHFISLALNPEFPARSVISYSSLAGNQWLQRYETGEGSTAWATNHLCKRASE
jgi:hypothetical protein